MPFNDETGKFEFTPLQHPHEKPEFPGVLEEDLQRFAEQRKAHMRNLPRFVPFDQPGADRAQLNRIEAKVDQLLELHGRPQSVIILADPQIDRIAAELKGRNRG